MPTGFVDFRTSSLASANFGCTFAVISITNLLIAAPGTNVLAAERHESGLGDFNIYFGASLDFVGVATMTSPNLIL